MGREGETLSLDLLLCRIDGIKRKLADWTKTKNWGKIGQVYFSPSVRMRLARRLYRPTFPSSTKTNGKKICQDEKYSSHVASPSKSPSTTTAQLFVALKNSVLLPVLPLQVLSQCQTSSGERCSWRYFILLWLLYLLWPFLQQYRW